MSSSDGHAPNFAEAMNLWIRLTEVDRKAHSLELRHWDVRSMHRELHEALSLDPTDVTAFLLLEGFRAEYFKQRVFSIEEMIDDVPGTTTYIADVTRLRDMLRAPDVVSIGDGFADLVTRGLRSYGIERQDVDNVVADRFLLGLLRRDALRSAGSLRVNQFLRGEPEAEDFRPVRIPHIHQFWNVNSLLRAACAMPSGVSLNLIRDPDAYQSYFVFAVRNGGNLYLVSDLPNHSHPMERYLSRRPDKDLSERASRNWFPYDLLMHHDEELDRVVLNTPDRSIVPFQAHSVPIKRIADLAPKELIWTTMVFDILANRFFREAPQHLALSYTGEMVRVRDSLLGSPEAALVPLSNSPAIDAQPLTLSDVLSDNLPEGAIGSDGGSPNAWLEERYAHLVPADVLNLTATDATGFILPQLPGALGSKGNAGTDLVAVSKATEVISSTNRHSSFDQSYRLRAFDPTSFGTEDRILADRVFIGRHNLAIAIQRLADAEFASRKDEVQAWYKDRVLANADALLAMACRGTAWRHAQGPQDAWDFEVKHGLGYRSYLMETYDLEAKDSLYHTSFASIWVHKGFDKTKGSLCLVNGTKSRWKVMFTPKNADDLAVLAGCTKDQLPDVLQHWQHQNDHEGNHLTSRIDPMAWALHNPWTQITANVSVFLSQRAMTALKKRHGVQTEMASSQS